MRWTAIWHASLGQLTRGMPLAALGLAFADWAIHFATQPGRGGKHMLGPWRRALRPVAAGGAHPLDRRLEQAEWTGWPACHLRAAWWGCAAEIQDLFRDVAGVDRHHSELVNFVVRQWLLMCSPANSALFNPLVQKKTVTTQGANFASGALNWAQDFNRRVARTPPLGSKRSSRAWRSQPRLARWCCATG